MLDPERIAKIEAMTEAQMRAEIEQGRYSAYGEESRQYMAKRLAWIAAERAHQTEVAQAQQVNQTANANDVAREGNAISQESNTIAREAGATGRDDLRWVKWTAIIALAGVIVAVGVVRCT